jgi:hypothetical protein
LQLRLFSDRESSRCQVNLKLLDKCFRFPSLTCVRSSLKTRPCKSGRISREVVVFCGVCIAQSLVFCEVFMLDHYQLLPKTMTIIWIELEKMKTDTRVFKSNAWGCAPLLEPSCCVTLANIC